jgi:integrase
MACIAKRRGRYVIDFYDNQGKRRWQTLKKGTTKKKAREILRDIEDRINKGTYIHKSAMPSFSQVAKDWLEHKKTNLRASTWSTYEGHTRNHFNELDNIIINRITIADIEKFITERQDQGMNILSLRKILVSLGQIFAYAVRHRYIDFNPVKEAEKPKGQGNIKKEVIKILSPEEINKLIDATEDKKYRVIFKLAIMSGARQGEILGLKWSDIDWHNSQIHIQRTYNCQAWYDTKTETSNRKIDIGPSMMAELKRWKLECLPNKLNLVFPNKAGGPIDHNNLLKRNFYPAIEKAKLGKFRFHDLRHSYCSLLIDQGENIKYIQSQLGHSSPTVTLNVYAHLMKPVNQEAAIRLENAIF